MKLCIISPTSGLQEYATQSEGVHLALIHLVETDPVYAQFYLEQSKKGDVVIMDNGAFEFGKPASTDRMLRAAEKIQASVLVAPDYPGQLYQKTIDSTRKFADVVRPMGQYTVMGCPQSVPGDVEGWIEGVDQMSLITGLSHIGVSILATPTAFGPRVGIYNDIELCRLLATFTLKTWIQGGDLELRGKKLHYLGAGHRLDLIQYYDIADSLDTSSPVWHGWNGIGYEHGYLPKGKSKLPVDFDIAAPSEENHCRIQHNIAVLKAHARASEVNK